MWYYESHIQIHETDESWREVVRNWIDAAQVVSEHIEIELVHAIDDSLSEESND